MQGSDELACAWSGRLVENIEMNCRKFWNLAAAIAAALVVMALLGREARAETLYTERPAELRSSPADDSQVIKRVGKGKSLEVVKRLGTWVMVKYEGRSGWIRRTSLSTDQVAGGGSGDDDRKDAKKKDRKKADADEDEEVVERPKPAAAGAKRTAARRRAERRKSRSKRRQMEEEEVASRSRKKRSSDDEEEDDDEEMTPKRPRSTWSKRSNIPGGPLKVEIQARSVQAFSQPDGTGRVVFTAAEGDSVRVIGKGENRWLLVENTRKRQGWIPAVTVRDHGLLLDARKDSGELAEESSRSDDEEAPDADTDEIAETRTASADDSEDGDADDEGSKSEDLDASLGASSDDDLAGASSPWIVGAGLRAGFTTVGMDITPVGVMNPQEGAYSGPTAGITGDLAYRFSPRLSVGLDVDYNYANALSGLTFTNNGAEDPNKVKLAHHRVGARAGVSYGKQLVGTFRAGFQYAALQVNDIANTANLPRETTSGPTVGLGVAYKGLAGGSVGVRLGADALLLGSRSQTQGNRDGLELGSLTSFWGTLLVDYWLSKNLMIGGGYRFGYNNASWTGASERIPGANETDVKDQGHELSLGVGYQL
jgi:hypothetical protein